MTAKFASISFACCLMFLSTGCTERHTSALETGNVAPRKLEVELTSAAPESLTLTSEFTGNLLPRKRTVVVSEVDGTVREIPSVGPKIDVEVNGQRYVEQLGIGYGHEVKEGDVLVQLDPTDFELELLVGRAKLAKATAELAELRAWERPETIERLQAVRDEMQARHKQALVDLERSKGLGAAISASEMDMLALNVATTRAILKSHEATLDAAESGPTAEELSVQEAMLAQAEAEVRQQERNLAKATIRAPYDGVVTDMYVEVGERVSAASGMILELMDIRFLVAEVGVPEAYMNQIQLLEPASVLVAGSKDPVPGLIVSMNDKLDPESRSFRVRVAIDNIERRFKAGQFARVVMNIGSEQPQIVLPSRCIVFDEGQPGVFVFQDGRVERRTVTLGGSNETRTEILDGIAVGESIVVDDPALLADGMLVDAAMEDSKRPR